MSDLIYNPNAPQWIPDDTQLEFEKRVLTPSAYPVLNNPDGSYSTHRMAWGDADGKFYAYPTIVTGPDGKLIQLDDDLAFSHALESKQYRMFTTPEDAAAYAEGGYKNSWGRGELNKKGEK